jgi:hypothetical protein
MAVCKRPLHGARGRRAGFPHGDRRTEGITTCGLGGQLGLYQQGEGGRSFVELFAVASWEEHLREHDERLTGVDRDHQQTVSRLSASPAEVGHLISVGVPSGPKVLASVGIHRATGFSAFLLGLNRVHLPNRAPLNRHRRPPVWNPERLNVRSVLRAGAVSASAVASYRDSVSRAVGQNDARDQAPLAVLPLFDLEQDQAKRSDAEFALIRRCPQLPQRKRPVAPKEKRTLGRWRRRQIWKGS